MYGALAMSRDTRMRQMKGQAVLRALHEDELADAGAKRTDALKRAEVELDRIARLLPGALSAGIGMTEISQLTGVSRPTLYELRGRYSAAEHDLMLAVLQTILARQESSFPDALADHLGVAASRVRPVVEELFSRGWIEWALDEAQPRNPFPDDGLPFARDHEGRVFPYDITKDGYDALERWKFEETGSTGATG